jgi:hypothetical protein
MRLLFFIGAFSASGLVGFFLAYYNLSFLFCFAVRDIGNITASHTDRMQLGNIIGYGQ